MGAGLADLEFINKSNNGTLFYYLSLIFFVKYAWVVSLKGKRCVTIANTFQKILDEARRKPNKIWEDTCR